MPGADNVPGGLGLAIHIIRSIKIISKVNITYMRFVVSFICFSDCAPRFREINHMYQDVICIKTEASYKNVNMRRRPD